MMVEFFRKYKFKNELILLSIVLIFIFFTLFKIIYYPVYIDEATTYNDYVSKGFLATISSYKEPNNHVFFSILLVLFTKLPVKALIAMRLLNVVFALSSIIMLYKYLKRKYVIEIVYVCLIFFCFSYYFLFYSIFARGYMVLIFCTISIFYLLDGIIDTPYRKKPFVFFSLISWVGFCTIPIFLYIYLSFILLIVIRLIRKEYSFKLVFPFILSSFITFFGVILFYIPIIMHNGINAIVANKWTIILSYNQVFDYLSVSFLGFYDKIFGIRSFWIIVSILFYGIFIFFKRKHTRSLLIQYFTFIFIPFVFIVLHKVIPGTRTWSYLIVPFTLLFALFLNELLFVKQISTYKRMFPVLALIVVFVQIYIFNKSHVVAAIDNDFYYGKVAKFLLKNHPRHIVFSNGSSSYESVLYKFYKKTQRKKIKIINDRNYSIFYVGNKEVCIKFNHKKVLYADPNINLYVFQIISKSSDIN